MARLEIEIAGVNAELKRILKESKIELSNFSKGLNFDNKGVNNLNTSLEKTKQLLKDISVLSKSAASSLGSLNTKNITSSLAAEKLAMAQAKTEAANFATEAARLRSELAAANLETAKGKTNAQQYATEAAKLRSQLAALKLSQQEAKQQVVAASGSYKEAQQRLTALGQAIRNAQNGFVKMTPELRRQIKDYNELNDKLKKFDATMGNHQRNVGNYAKALQGLKGLAATYFGFTALLATGRTVIKNNAEISDSLADVRRTAGLTAKEATQLGVALKSINTRTSLSDLLGISVIGGQLGIAKDQLAGFTKAVDQLSVSLSGELKGGAEGIAKSLGVLDNIFKVSAGNGGDVEKAYNQIGSAILNLGQSGLATGDFLADFGERVGGIAKQAGLSLPVILSYGAVLQENGVNAEVAGTAFKRLLSALATNSTKFFAVAQMADANLTLEQFNTIVNTDTKRALDLFFAGLKKGGTSTIAFNSILKTLKLSQAGVSQSIAAISDSLPSLNAHIKESSGAMEQGTLSSEQFAIKNNTLAASLDKLSNAFTNISTNPDSNLGGLFKGLIDSITGGIKVIDILLEKLKKVQYDSAIERFNKQGKTGNVFIDESDVKAEKSRRATLKQQAIQNQALTIGRKLAHDAVLDIKAEGNASERLALELEKLNKLRAEYNVTKSATGKDDVAKQLIAQRELVRLLNIELDKGKARSNAATPEGFITGSKSRKTSYGGGAGTTSADILAKSVASSAIAEEEGVDKTLERLKQRYIGYYSDLDKLAAKKGADRNKIEADRSAIQANEIKERGAIELAETQRVESERQRILDTAGVKTAESIQKDLLAIDARYNQEIEKAKGNAILLAAIATGKEAEINAVFEKYAQKRAEKEQEIFDKINDITEKGFTENLKHTIRGSQKIDEQLKDRLKQLEGYFSELRKMTVDPLMGIGLGVAQSEITKQITSQADQAKNPRTNLTDLFDQDFNSAIRKFGDDFVNTLRNINREADETFGSVLGRLGTTLWTSLSESVGDIFINQFKTQFSDAIKSASQDLSTGLKGAIAVSGLLGGAISGLTKKTSGVGQGIGGALTGAATGAGAAIGIGAALGSAAGPLGIGIGAAVGGLVGLFKGIFGAKKARKQEELQKAQLAEQQKQTKLLERQNALAYASSIIGQQTNQGIVTGIERDATGNLVAKVAGKDMLLILERAKQDKKRGIL